MSFSSSIKDELLKLKIRADREKLAALSALTHTAGSMTLAGGRGVGIQYVSEHLGVAKLMAQLAGALYDVDASIAVRENERLKTKNCIVLLRGQDCLTLLCDIGCLTENEGFSIGHVPEKLVSSDKTRRLFIRGAFLGAGSVSDPKKGYHAEFVCRYESFATGLCDMINAYGLNARVAPRKSVFVVYIKEGDKVSDLIKLLGAMDAAMRFEEDRVVRNLKNDLNRKSNFEDANMNKAALAAAKQCIDIELIRATRGLHTLSKPLFEAAEIRLNNPEASLMEIASMLGIGKSGVNHRFMKIAAIAEGIRLQQGKQV